MKIEKLDHYGRGISHHQGKTYFVSFALPEEEVEVVIQKEKKIVEAELSSIKKESFDRIAPICPYYGACGGCHLMHMSEDLQKKFKIEKVHDLLKKFAKIEVGISSLVSFSSMFYRNKVVFHVEKEKLGFYHRKTHDLVEIDSCYLLHPKINELIPYLKCFIKENQVDMIEVRIGNQTEEILLSLVGKKITNIQSLLEKVDVLVVNQKVISSKTYLISWIGNKKYILSPFSFFQVNEKVCAALYDKIKEIVSRMGSRKILDLYCGTGTIGIYLSDIVEEVLGIEVVPNAIQDAKENQKLNSVSNSRFLLGKVEEKIGKIRKYYDTVIVDPPRSGLDKKVIPVLFKLLPKQIIYISCDPVTMARDIERLKEKYEVVEVTLFDMFPNTYHVECVCVLKLRKAL